jgi:hypothetical protein
MARSRSRQSFAARTRTLLGTDDPAIARLAFALDPKLFERLLAEWENEPENLHSMREAVYVHAGHDSDAFELCHSAVTLETWYKQDHRRDDIDNALVHGWCEMQEAATKGLWQSRLDNNVRDMAEQATDGGLWHYTKPADQWLNDLLDWCGVSQNMASDLHVL